MSKRKRFRLQFSEPQRDFASPSPSQVPLSKYYSSIHQLPLNRFIDCMVDDNLHALVISGDPNMSLVAEAWNDIREQYSLCIGNSQVSNYVKRLNEINQLKANIDMIYELIQVLRHRYVKRFADRLNDLLFTEFVFDISNLTEYDKLLNGCYNRTAGLKMRLDMLIINFKAIQEANQVNYKKPTREYFLSMLVTLSDFAQFMIPDTITVFEFCERIKRANEKNEIIKNQIKDVGGKR